MLTFETPLFLFLLAVVPLGIYGRHFGKQQGGAYSFPLGVWKGNEFSGTTALTRLLVFMSNTALWLSVVLCIVALAGPGIIERQRVYLTRGIDIMFVLDESPSMAAQDFLPENRFGAARKVIKDFAVVRENDSVGLVVFSSEAALRIPPTLDYESFVDSVDSLELMSMGKGTAIGMGLSVAALHLRGSSARRKVIILLTDGDNNAGEILPESAAEIAGQLGIVIYCIGVGASGEVPGEYADPDTGKIYRGTFSVGFNQELLQDMAEKTGGRYFSAQSAGALETVFSAIDSLETTEKRIKVEISSRKMHRQVIFASLVCFFFYFCIRKIILGEAV